MADPIGAALADLAVKKLVTKGYGVISSLMDLQSELQDTTTLIEAALLDGDSMSDQCSRTQQVTLEKLSCLLDRLLDLSDVRASRELQKQVMSGGNFTKELRSFFSASNQAVARFKDAWKVDGIKKKLNAIARNHAMISSICSKATQARSIQSAESSSSNILTNFVIGRNKERDRIVSMLSEDSLASGTTLSVSSIVGIGGMGKTTLAWYVYNDDRMKRSFDVQFWVSPTQDFDVQKVLVEMITACGEGELPHNQSSMAQLYHHFRRAIGGKKFLLVLDNIWDHNNDLRDKWLNLRKLLEFGANGSKVLITTRDQKVAGVLDSTASCMLGDLTEDDSCLLFQEIAFTQWQEAGVEAIGLEIAKMCPKVPLVIRSIGGLLAGKRTVQEWLAFRDEFQLANFASFGSDVVRTLKFSFDQLDATQKLCVTYFSLFEKGGEFAKDEMIHRWIALGYVKPAYEKQSLEEAGDECMISLLNCGFLRLAVFRADALTMHDVMYELVVKVSGFKYKVADSNTVEIDERVRHLSFWKAETCSFTFKGLKIWEVPSSVFKLKNLQSLIRGSDRYKDLRKLDIRNLSMCGKLISKFESLRVLDLEEVKIKELPTSVGDLICLRFLNLFNSNIVELPNSITRLVNLQSLYLGCCLYLEKLPRDMSKLVNLRHLKLKGSVQLRHMPMGLGKLTDLRTLDTFIVGNQFDLEVSNMGRLADLNQLNNLSGRLDIVVRRESKYIALSEINATNLKMKENLRELDIRFKNGTKEDKRVLECLQPPCNLTLLNIKGYGGERLPGWMMDNLHNHHFPCLTNIVIKDCKSCIYLCSFGRFPHLEGLFLSGLDEVEYLADNENELSQAPLFPSLLHLEVREMPKLKGWWGMTSNEQDSKEDMQLHAQVQHQHQHLVNWKPAFPKLGKLCVDSVELAIIFTRQQIPSLKDLYIKGSSIGEQSHQQQAYTLPFSSCFPNLEHLEIGRLSIKVLPEGIRDLSTLQTLTIDQLEIIEVPEWIDSLTSLETLSFHLCPRLESLPHQIVNLNLFMFSISSCDKLREKCQSPNGEYWHLIQHIPYLFIH